MTRDLPPHKRLLKELTEAAVMPSYHRAVEKGVFAGLAAFPDDLPDKQLRTARAVALQEFAKLMGWDQS